MTSKVVWEVLRDAKVIPYLNRDEELAYYPIVVQYFDQSLIENILTEYYSVPLVGGGGWREEYIQAIELELAERELLGKSHKELPEKVVLL